MQILLVDDDSTFRLMIDQMLKELGYSVTMANDGWEGLIRFNKKKFELVITDFSMPGMNGAELTREIRRKSPRTHIIILTAFRQNDDVKAVFEGDVNVYFVVKADLSRRVVGIHDALFASTARIDLHQSPK